MLREKVVALIEEGRKTGYAGEFEPPLVAVLLVVAEAVDAGAGGAPMDVAAIVAQAKEAAADAARAAVTAFEERMLERFVGLQSQVDKLGVPANPEPPPQQ